MSNDQSNYGNWYGSWGPMTPLMDQWTAAIKTWTDAWSSFMPGGRQGFWPMPPWMPQAPASGFPAAGAPAPISVEVSSLRPTQVTVNLKPGTGLMELAADSFSPPLRRNVTLQPRSGVLQVRVSVAPDQPTGRYNGVIRAADGSVAGDISIVISDTADAD
jgi:hypothetical protein